MERKATNFENEEIELVFFFLNTRSFVLGRPRREASWRSKWSHSKRGHLVIGAALGVPGNQVDTGGHISCAPEA